MYIQITFVGIMLLLIVSILDMLNITKNAARLVAEICAVMTAGLVFDHFRPDIVAFSEAHPYWFWGYIVPAMVCLIGVLYEELTSPTGFIFVGSLIAFIPAINVAMVTVAFCMIVYTVITDPKYMWRGMKERFNFTKKQ
jgi:hypothetical protein